MNNSNNDEGYIQQLEKQLAQAIKAKEDAEKALEQMQARSRYLDGVLERSAQPFILGDSESNLIFINQAFCDLVGYTEDEIKNMDWKKVLTPEEWLGEELIHMAEINKEGASLRYEKEYLRRDGTRVPVELLVHVIKGDKDRSQDVFYAFATDLSDSKAIEKTLRTSEQMYRLLADNTVDSIWLMNLDLDFSYINPAVKTMTGHTPEEWIGTNLRDHCDEKNFAIMAEAVLEGMATLPQNTGVLFEAEMLKKDGTPIAVEITGRVLLGPNDEPMGLQGVTRDITERKAAREALKNAEMRHRMILDAQPNFIVLQDLNHKIIWANATTCKALDKSLDELVEESCYEVWGLGPESCMACPNKQAMEARESRSAEIVSPEGRVLKVTASPVFDHDGQVVSMVEVIEDVTASRHLEEQLRQSRKMDAIGQLAGGIAHDFNNMLGVISGNLELIMEEVQEGDPNRDELEEIRQATDRSVGLVRQLLAFARRQTAVPQVITLDQIIKNSMGVMQRLIGEDVQLSFFGTKLPWKVKMDPFQVDQILANLMVNSRDAMSKGGQIVIETSNMVLDSDFCQNEADLEPGDYILLSVSDNGSGMDQNTVEKIFEPFFSTKPEGKGTGLGLSTVYGIVRQNRGDVKVFSEPGLGSVFKIYLPRYSGVVTQTAKSVIKEKPRGNETVLVVEDEVQILELCKRILERLGYQVIPARGPEEALEQCEQHTGRIDLLVTDVVMPSMNGKELAEAISKKHPEIKILFMSGYPAEVIANKGVIADGFHFVQKPFTGEDLSKRVRSVLDS